jgi:hypothetical protein
MTAKDKFFRICMKSNKEISMISFPLYHGTSSYFLSEIATHGLGGKNIANEWGIFDFFKEVVSESNKVDDPEFKKNLQDSQPMLDRVLGIFHNPTGFNYRYGSVYLAVNAKRATRYSMREFGSELSRISYGWYCELKKFEPSKAIELLNRYPKISELFSAVHSPIVIEIIDVAIDDLATEGGLIGDNLKKEIEEFLEMKEKFGSFLDESINGPSFEYIGLPIMKDNLRFFKVESQNKGNKSYMDSSLLIPTDINDWT